MTVPPMSGPVIDPTPFLGVPFEAGGRTRSGWDCWGCVRAVSRTAFGVELPDYADLVSAEAVEVPRAVGPAILREALSFRVLPGWAALPGDPGALLLFSVAGHPAHIAIDIGGGWMLHQRAATVAEPFAGSIWERRFLGAYRAG
jgi:cell wall-associated NlpC family hydrolase